MKLIINKKYYSIPSNRYQGTDYLIIDSKPFKIRWFTDCNDWFFYIYLGRRYFRFSSAGFMQGKLKKEWKF